MTETVAGPEVGSADLDAFSALVGRMRALPADDPVRLRAERVAESFFRDGQRGRRAARRAGQSETDAELNASTALGSTDRRMDAPMQSPEEEPLEIGRASCRERV